MRVKRTTRHQPYEWVTDLKIAAASLSVPLFRAIIGGGFLAIAILAALSIASWNVTDPSLTHVTNAPAKNMLGVFGASFSDLTIQLLGLGSIALILPFLGLGLKIFFSHMPTHVGWRVTTSFVSAFFVAGFASALPSTPKWPLPTGLGGVVGDTLYNWIQSLFDITTGYQSSFIAAVIFLSIGLVILIFASAILAVKDEDHYFYDEHDHEEHLKTDIQRVLKEHEPTQKRTTTAYRDPYDHADEYISEDDDFEQSESGLQAFLGSVYHMFYMGKMRITRAFSTSEETIDNSFHKDLIEPVFDHQPSHELSNIRPIPMPAVVNPHLTNVHVPTHEELHTPANMQSTQNEAIQNVHHHASGGASSAQQSGYGTSQQHLSQNIQTPPRVQAPITEIPQGKRIVQEAQVKLFSYKDSFELPPLSMLTEPVKSKEHTPSLDALEQNARLLEQVLEDFGVKGDIINVRPGPVVTLYELQPAPGIKSSRVIGLADDIARSMSAISARVAVIPGRNVIGIELPNKNRQTVFLREMLASKNYEDTKSRLPLSLGKTIDGEPVIGDLARMPHLLIAGTTGSGKSVAINTMILSLLYKHSPEECRLIMIDPKMLELSVYDGIPHLLSPVVTDPKKAVVALKWVVREMEERYKNMSKLGVRNIDGFNARIKDADQTGEALTRTVQTGFDEATGQAIYEQEEMSMRHMPYIVVIVDEMADLMMVAGKEIEGAVQRLAQMARAAGIHIIMATQRPSVDVITGTIKANFPTRVSFQVTSKIDSRTILGEQGAEQLLGQGDMLYMAGGGRISRVHGPFVADKEVEHIVNHLKSQGAPEYLQNITESDEEDENGDMGSVFDNSSMGTFAQDETGGDLYEQAVQIVLRDGKASTSYIQRRLSVGYNRAASLIERMENEGIISHANHVGKREILIKKDGDSESAHYGSDDEDAA